jgi:hypothetical protein
MIYGLSDQTKRSFLISEKYDRLLELVQRYDLVAPISNILVGRLKKRNPEDLEDQDLIDQLHLLCTTMEELNSYGALKDIDPYEIKNAKLQTERDAAIHKFRKLKREIKAEAKKYNNIAGLNASETPKERDVRWQSQVKKIMASQNCSERSALKKVVKSDRSSGYQVPGDPHSAYQRAKRRP